VNNARKVKIDSAETKEIKTTMNQGKTTAEKVAYIYQQDPDFNRSKVAELLGVSRQQVYNIIKNLNSHE
jgi:DNA-binding transcriptional regulator LsrR (DeoR family)